MDNESWKTRQHLFKEVFSCRYHLQETKQLHVEDFFLMAAAYWSLGRDDCLDHAVEKSSIGFLCDGGELFSMSRQ